MLQAAARAIGSDPLPLAALCRALNRSPCLPLPVSPSPRVPKTRSRCHRATNYAPSPRNGMRMEAQLGAGWQQPQPAEPQRSPRRAAPAAAAGPTPAPNGRRVRAGRGARPDRGSPRCAPSPAATGRAQRPPASPAAAQPRAAPRAPAYIHTYTGRRGNFARRPQLTGGRRPRGGARPGCRLPPSAARRALPAGAGQRRGRSSSKLRRAALPSLLFLSSSFAQGEAEEKRRAMSAESAHVPGPLRAAHRSAALRRLRRARPPARLGARARQLRAVRPPGLSGLPPGCSALLRGVAEGVPGAVLEKEGKEECRLPVLLPFLPFFFFYFFQHD